MQSVNSYAQFLLSADFYSRTTICDHGLGASSTAVIALKQKGASEAVLDAVVWAGPFDTRTKQQQELDCAAPGLPNSAGIYYGGPSAWVRLR